MHTNPKSNPRIEPPGPKSENKRLIAVTQPFPCRTEAREQYSTYLVSNANPEYRKRIFKG